MRAKLLVSAAALSMGVCGCATHARAPSTAAARSLTDLVDPFIGTANEGNTYPGAVRPFGMLSWSPTSTAGDQTSTAAANGYAWETTRLRGFALTHVNGAGCHPGAMGDIPIMPYVGAMTTSPSADTTDAVYASDFSHADEKAVPGRYALRLANGVATDFAATLRAGIGTFAFPRGDSAHLLFRTSSSLNGSEAAETTVEPSTRTVTGSVLTGAFCGRRRSGNGSNKRSYYRLYFVAELDTPFEATGTWVDADVRPGTLHAVGGEGYETGGARAGRGSGAWVSFASGAVVAMRVGISFTSVEAARANLAAEIATTSTASTIAADARRDWASRLERIEVSGGTPVELTKLYTALYHALLQPNVVSDRSGRYFGADGRLHDLASGQAAQYGNFSGWDQYRAHTQLLALLEPEIASDFAQSLLNDAEAHDGIWDRWVHLTAWTHVMTGDPSAPALAGMYAFGARRFEVEKAFDSLYRQATVPRAHAQSSSGCPGQCAGIRPNLATYLETRYMPEDAGHVWGGAAETLEDSLADWALADWAHRLGRKDAETKLRERGGYWKNTFNPRATAHGGYQQARNADGTWVVPFDPATDRGFAQGTSSTYTWMVPHDVRALATMMGGVDVAAARLDAFFHDARGRWVTHGDPLRYDATNEPALHVPWMYVALGKPWKTQETVRAMERLAYGTGPKGLPGNDDLGTMSAWYVFAALGLYPQTPARAELLLSSPVFPHTRIHRHGGATLSIVAPDASPENLYIDAATLDGRALDRAWLPEAFVERGGELRLRLRATPNTRWATAERDRPVDR